MNIQEIPKKTSPDSSLASMYDVMQQRKEQFVNYCMFESFFALTGEPLPLLRIQEALCFFAIKAAVSSIYNNQNNNEFKEVGSKIHTLDENLSHSNSWSKMKKMYRKMRWTRDDAISLRNQDYLDFLCIGTILFVLMSDKKILKIVLAKKEYWSRLVTSGAADLGFNKLVCTNEDRSETAKRYAETPLSNAQNRKNIRRHLLESMLLTSPMQNLIQLLYFNYATPEEKQTLYTNSHFSMRPVTFEDLELDSFFWNLFENHLGDAVEFNLFAPLFAFIPASDPNNLSTPENYNGPQFHSNLYDYCSIFEIEPIMKSLLALINNPFRGAFALPIDFAQLEVMRRHDPNGESFENKKQCCNSSEEY